MNRQELREKIDSIRPEYIDNLIELATSSFSTGNTVIQSVRTLESIYRALDDLEGIETEEEGNATRIIDIG